MSKPPCLTRTSTLSIRWSTPESGQNIHCSIWRHHFCDPFFFLCLFFLVRWSRWYITIWLRSHAFPLPLHYGQHWLILQPKFFIRNAVGVGNTKQMSHVSAYLYTEQVDVWNNFYLRIHGLFHMITNKHHSLVTFLCHILSEYRLSWLSTISF